MNKNVLFILAIICVSGKCKIAKNSNSNTGSIHSYEVNETFPIISKDGKLDEYDTIQAKIYTYKDMIIHQTFYNYETYSVENANPKTEKGTKYCLFYKGSREGLLYDTISKILGKKIMIDSVLGEHWHYKINIFTLLNQAYKKLVYQKSNQSSNNLEEVYLIKRTPESEYRDTCFLYYSDKLKSIPYSFSKELDSINNSKLFKVRITNYPSSGSFFKDYIEQSYWLVEKQPEDLKRLIILFDELKRISTD